MVRLSDALEKEEKKAVLREKEEDEEFKLLKNLKLKSIYIENHKLFKGFTLTFTDKNEKIVPLIILAGVNGTGKTTLLEFINNFANYIFDNKEDRSFIELENNNGILKLNNNTSFLEYYVNGRQQVYESKISRFVKNNIIYLSFNVDNIDNIQNEISNFYINLAEKLDSFKKAFKEVDLFFKKIFNDLELSFIISKIDYNNKEVFFQNTNGDEFSINKLSTGEKNLLSKVFYLYLNDIKNKVILIDEPELSIHPSWQNKILKIYENFALNNNCQIIIATHSPHIIGSAKNEYIRFLVQDKESNSIVVKQLDNSPLDRDMNTVIKTLMGADYISKELDELHKKYRKLFDEDKLNTEEASKLKEEILKYESPNSSFFQSIAFDMELME